MSREYPFFGEKECCKCKRSAYYFSEGDEKVYCGFHLKKDKRRELKKNPKQKEIQIKKLKDYISLLEKEFSPMGDAKVRMYDMKTKMMKRLDFAPPYINIFPNFKHGSRTDGLGYPSLSPKFMGPILHYQKCEEIPEVSQTIEGFHQFNKFFKGEDLSNFSEIRKEGYLSSNPKRHKFGHTKDEHLSNLKKMDATLSSGANINIPLYSIAFTPEGEEKHLSYFESRIFYCCFYKNFLLSETLIEEMEEKGLEMERLLQSRKDFNFLKVKIRNGISLNICGFDAFDVGELLVSENHEELMRHHYLDTSKPFGHEAVLMCLLLEIYPWEEFIPKEFEYLLRK